MKIGILLLCAACVMVNYADGYIDKVPLFPNNKPDRRPDGHQKPPTSNKEETDYLYHPNEQPRRLHEVKQRIRNKK